MKYICLSLLLCATHPVVALPQDESASRTQPSEPEATQESLWLIGFEGCKKKDGMDPQFIYDAWAEFEKMVPEQHRPGDDDEGPSDGYPWLDDWNSGPAVDFFGPAERTLEYRKAIRGNLDKLASVRRGFFTFWTLHVRCDDPRKRCPKAKEPDPEPCDPCDPNCKNPMEPKPPKAEKLAYVMSIEGYKDHINFCPGFFNLPPLDNAIDRMSRWADVRDHLGHYSNRAFTIAHELTHVTWICKRIPDGTKGGTLDIDVRPEHDAYRTQDTKWLSYSDSRPSTEALNNAQNYAHYLLARYIIEKKGFYPSGNVWNTDLDPPPPPPPEEQILEEHNSDDDSTDINIAEPLSCPIQLGACERNGSATCNIPPPSCYSREGSSMTKYTSIKELISGIKDYCEHLDFQKDDNLWKDTKTYNPDTPGAFTIGFQGYLLSNKTDLPTKDNCIKHLLHIVNACDADQDFHWKAGGWYEIGQWTWSIVPETERPVAANNTLAWCTVRKHSSIDLWGAGWSSVDFGEELKGAIENTEIPNHPKIKVDTDDWKFDYELAETGHEWHASLGSQGYPMALYLQDLGDALGQVIRQMGDPAKIEFKGCEVET